MRRHVGVSYFQKRDEIGNNFRQVGDGLAAQELEQASLQTQIESFQVNLKDFARKHANDIRKDPTFRAHFQRMCANIGVDPLASNKGFWANLLGVGDFYYELGIQIIENCMATRSRDGGLTEMDELRRRLEASRSDGRGNKQMDISEQVYRHNVNLKAYSSLQLFRDDIARAIRTLKPLSGGFEVIQIGNRKMVRSVPKELDKDQSALLLLAQKAGYVSASMINTDLKWSIERTKNALERLLQDGLCWIDNQSDEDTYWIPSYFHLDRNK
ncbi:EAP30/Vps36 family-domain-containing protein [Dichotomocladium elegans]|nr:EAP30/Vps36 family-domain-containing protein [Dichotomocladium elegans]